MVKATKSKFRITRSGRLGAGPQFYDVGTIFHFLKVYADAVPDGAAEGDYAAYLEDAIASGRTFVRPEDSKPLMEFLKVISHTILGKRHFTLLHSVFWILDEQNVLKFCPIS